MSMELHARTTIKDSSFFFRIKRRGAAAAVVDQGAGTNGAGGSEDTSQGSTSSSSASKGDRFMYGFVFCRQRQDASLRRGGEQHSVVVLSEHPLSSALAPLSAVAGQQYFGSGVAALRQVYEEVCRWPPPVAGPQMQLPIGFTAITARLPALHTLPHPSATTAPEQLGAVAAAAAASLGSRPSSFHRRHPSNSQQDGLGLGLGSRQHLPMHASSSTPAMMPTPTRDNGLAQQLPLPPMQAPVPVAQPQHSTTQSPFVALQQQQVHQPADNGSAPAPASGNVSRSSSVSESIGTAVKTLAGQLLGMSTDGESAGQQQPAAIGPNGLPVTARGARSIPPPMEHHHSRGSSLVAQPSDMSDRSEDAPPTSPTPHTATNHGHSRSLSGGLSHASSQQLPRRVSLSLASAASGDALQGSAAAPIHGSFHEVDAYTALSGHLQRLWHLWEMALLGRPLMVVAPSPGDCSAAVAALLSLIAPLPYAPDFRPYYCIHDPAFSRLSGGALPGPGPDGDVPALIGVTNLYFVRALSHWPNILSVGKRETAQGTAPAAPAGGSSSGLAAAAASVLNPNAAVQALRQRTQGAAALLSGHMESLWSKYRPVTRPDQALLLRLLQPKQGDVKSKVARIAHVNSEAIRRHFGDLTLAFLSPFGRYFEPGADGRVAGWNSEEFLFGLKSGAHPQPQPLLERVGSPAALVELYARFVSSLNFAAWFAMRRRPLAHLIAPPLPPPDTAAATGLGAWFASAAKHIDEVELVGMFFSTEQQLMDATAEAALPDSGEEAGATVERLQRELVLLFFGMGEELQLTCISSPARRALLQGMQLSAPQAGKLQQLADMLQGG